MKTAEKKRFSLIYILSYYEKDPGIQNVKVEVNRRNFGSQYVIKSYLGISMKVMTPEDMAANKPVAFYERIGKANRDIYDIWFYFAHNWSIKQELLKKEPICHSKNFLKQVVTSWKKWTIKTFFPVWERC